MLRCIQAIWRAVRYLARRGPMHPPGKTLWDGKTWRLLQNNDI